MSEGPQVSSSDESAASTATEHPIIGGSHSLIQPHSPPPLWIGQLILVGLILLTLAFAVFLAWFAQRSRKKGQGPRHEVTVAHIQKQGIGRYATYQAAVIFEDETQVQVGVPSWVKPGTVITVVGADGQWEHYYAAKPFIIFGLAGILLIAALTIGITTLL